VFSCIGGKDFIIATKSTSHQNTPKSLPNYCKAKTLHFMLGLLFFYKKSQNAIY